MRHTVRVPESPIPQHCPTARELDDLELLVHGALAPLTGFEGADGLVTLQVPPSVADAARAAGSIELVDPEGVPLAHVEVASTYDAGELTGIEGPVTTLTHNEFGAFRRLYLTPTEVSERYDAGALTVPVAGPLTVEDLDRIRTSAGGAPVLLLALTGTGTPELSAPALVRATLAAARHLDDAHVVAVPLASRGDAEADHRLGERVVDAYAPGRVLGVTGMGELPDDIAAIVERDQPAPEEQGLVLFFTGLSGSGKSTLARALHDVVLEQGARTVTSLDGDVVRRNLSAGLTFSKEDRETNIRRIGWVAAEISRHGGVAICSPIAPFDSTRAAGPPDGRGSRRGLRAGPRRDAARGVRAPRPQGSLRQGTRRRDPRVHRDLLPLRGARGRRRAGRHHRAEHRGRPRRRARPPARSRLPDEGPPVNDLLTTAALSVLLVSFGVGIVVGLTGMGGGALMTPALIFLGVNPSAAVANDLVAASVNKSVGATVHWRHGKPNLKLAGLLICASVPTAFAGAFIVDSIGAGEDQEAFLKAAIGCALLFTAGTYALRMYLQLRHVTSGNTISQEDPEVRPLPTLLVGAVGGLLVGITSVGSGSLIMVALLLLYPTLSALRLVGTDLVQAVPLVLSAAISHVIVTGVDWAVLIPLIVGGSPGTFLGARMANWVSQSVIRRGIVIVLTLTGLTMLAVPPEYVGIIGAALLLLGPLFWGFIRQTRGLPAFDNNAAAWRIPGNDNGA